MGFSFSAELLKLQKRPAMWVIALVFAVALLFFGYLLIYIFVLNAPGNEELQQQAREGRILQNLLPNSMLITLTSSFASFGSALALMLGALAMGSEYGWDTLKVSLTQRSSRLGFFTGKLSAVGLMLAVLTAVMFAISAVISYAIAVIEEENVEWPDIGELLEGFGASWLILATFAAMGVFFATLFRGSALAIGLGLVYLLVLEGLFAGLAAHSDTVENIVGFLPFKNSVDLADHFGESPISFINTPRGETVEPLRATTTLLVYTATFLMLAALFFKRRDQS